MKHHFTKSVITCMLLSVLLFIWLPAGADAYDSYPNTWENTGNQSRDIIGVAQTQLGFTEDHGDYVKYNEWYFGNTDTAVSWCSVFISWCAHQAGIPESVIPKNARARGWSVETMDSNPFGGTAFTLDQQKPRRGDILFTRTDLEMDPSLSSHCCLVTDVDDSYIYTIEGNIGTTGAVRCMQYTLAEGYEVFDGVPDPDYYIIFATRPDYTDSPEEDDENFLFYDVVNPESYYYTAVDWALEHNITRGINALQFGPDVSCTRAQVVTFLWRAAGEPDVSDVTNPFTDVNSTDYFYKAVLWALKYGITTGKTETTFAPYESCTRAQVVTFLYRNANTPKISGTTPFTDVNSGDYYQKAVLWAVKNGITTGETETTFAPSEFCTRAQVVTFLYRYYIDTDCR